MQVLRSRRSSISRAIRIGVLLIVLAIAVYGLVDMYTYGFYARTYEGIHWYSVIFFLAMLALYLVRDRISVLYAIPIALVYYCVHEAIFNVFFLSFHQFQNPPSALPAWYQEMTLIGIVTPLFLLLSWRFRRWLVRPGVWTIPYLVSWVGFMLLTIVWMNYGFPVSANVYGVFATNTPSRMANIFEISTNIVFTTAFYMTFSFKRTKTRPELAVVPAIETP